MKIGLIGSGVITDAFIQASLEVENVECIAIYSRKEETARKIVDKYQVKQIYTDYQSMLSDKNLNFIYIASPNNLHYEHAIKALENGKNVICEKPFTSTVKEAGKIIALAKSKNLYLFEAITTIHFPNFQKIKEAIPLLGAMKLVQCSFSQYSSRYDRLLTGEVANVFNPAYSGGSLADLNIYNLHFAAGLFGEPGQVIYFANMAENGIDTSGIALLKYEGFICECTGAKDSYSPSSIILQGTKGYIKMNGPPSECPSFELGLGNTVKYFNEHTRSNRLVYEIIQFEEMFHLNNYKRCCELMDHSLRVVRMAEAARKYAKILFPADLVE